ncbi:MAG: VWA domain-containing protein [Deltaproteobacteria bacterium]|nr:VWA domain-containing protein [Deltaproteobacteria bacterium]
MKSHPASELWKIALAALLVGGLIALALVLGRKPKPQTVALTVADLQAVHVGVSADDTQVRQLSRVRDGGSVKTEADGRARLRLDDGTSFVVGGNSRIAVKATSIRLEAGRVFAQAPAGVRTEVDLGGAVAILTGVNAAITKTEAPKPGTRVYAASGELTVRVDGRDFPVRTGETAQILGNQVTVAPERAFDDWTGGLAVPWGAEGHPSCVVGELWGRTNPGDVGSALSIRSQDVSVRIVGEAALTEIRSAFFHGGSVPVRGDFRLSLPEGAIVSGFASGTGDSLSEGSVRMASRQPTQGTANIPMLEWAGERWVRASIPSISPGNVYTIVVRYVQWLDPRPTSDSKLVSMQYRLPLVSEAAPPLVGEFSVRVNVESAAPGSIRAGMGAVVTANEIQLRKSDFRPTADFVLEFNSEAPQAPARIVSVPGRGDDEAGRYVLVRAQAPGGKAESGVSLVVVLDTSSSIDSGMLDTGRAFVEALTSALGPRDQMLVLGSDDSVRKIGPDKLGPVDDARRKAILDDLGKVTTAGATDLGRILEQAADALDPSSPVGMIVYVGDGWPSVGDRTPDEIRARLGRRASGMPRISAVAVGPTANRFGLSALVRGSGSVLEISDREQAAAEAATLMASALRPVVAGVQLSLGPDVEQVYPLHPRTVGAGETVWAVGRTRVDLPKDVTLRWREAAGPREERLQLTRGRIVNEDDVRRRWAAARVEEIALRGSGREAAVQVALRTALLTPWTAWTGPAESYIPTPLDLRALESGSWGEASWGLGAGAVSGPDYALADFSLDAPGGAEEGDDALKQAISQAASRVIDESLDSVRACRDSRAALRPDLAGAVYVRLRVDGEGRATDVRVTAAPTATDDALLRCVEAVISAISFPATGIKIQVEVTHEIDLPPARQAGKCSATSQLPVALRRGVWVERMRQAGIPRMAEVYLGARRACELPGWVDRRALLELILERVPGVARVTLARELELAGEADASTFLKREALRRATSPEELRQVRRLLLHLESYPVKTFEKDYLAAADDNGRLAVVRRFLALAPHDLRLRHRLLDLLEALGRKEDLTQEIARIRRDPFVDATLLAECATSLRRIGQEAEALKAFGEIVERAPSDPWARSFAGDRLRNEGWFDQATAVYAPLERQMSGEQSVLMRMAMAHEGAGRVDLATRLLTRLTQVRGRSERSDLGDLASDLGAVMLVQPRKGASEAARAEMSQRALELPFHATSTVLLVRAPSAIPPLDAKIVRGPANARQERGPDVWAHGLGLYRFVLQPGEGDVVLKLTAKKELPPARPIKVRVDALISKGVGKVPEVVTREIDVEPNGKTVEIKGLAVGG